MSKGQGGTRKEDVQGELEDIANAYIYPGDDEMVKIAYIYPGDDEMVKIAYCEFTDQYCS